MVRVHLTNRFGLAPVTFDHVTIGRQAAGAALIGPPATVTFGGKRSVTAAPGHDVVSDPVAFSYQAFQNLAVSVYASKTRHAATEHYEGRQTSYFTPDAAGDHTANTEGAAFSLYNSTRPFVNGLDVVASELRPVRSSRSAIRSPTATRARLPPGSRRAPRATTRIAAGRMISPAS